MIVIILGCTKVRVYYYLTHFGTRYTILPMFLWWISISALHWAFIDMLVARFAVARVGYNRINIFIYFLFFVIVCLAVGSRNPMRIPDKLTNKTQNEQWIKVFLRSIRIDMIVIILGCTKVRVYYYLSLRYTVHHPPHVPYGGYQYPPCTGRLLIC